MWARKRDAIGTLAVLTAVLSFYAAAYAQTTYSVLHSFGSGTDGGGPSGSVALDTKGRVYGATSGGGAYNGGTVFLLSPQPNGQWSEKILHNFPDSFDDAGDPNGGLVQGKGGHWYGTSQYGGTLNAGTVFELTHTPSGWQETVLYSFGTQSNDGGEPTAGLVTDGAGNLYGTAQAGGEPDHNDGTVFQLSPGPGDWEESVLYTFCFMSDTCPNGVRPYAGVVRDSSGNLYGTTAAGGTGCAGEGCGVVYELAPIPGGGWQETILYRFNNDGRDGYTPGSGTLALNSSGNLYGTTEVGGRYGWGIVFRLKQQPDGTWKERILHNFENGKAGGFPGGGVVRDAAGNLYGTTVFGGSPCDCGVIYKLAPGPNGAWTYSVLHRFRGSDGALPAGNLVFDQTGNLYGVTALGGAYGAGVVFQLTP